MSIISSGDRALYQGLGRRRGKQCDVMSVRRVTTSVRFDCGLALLVTTSSLVWVPRRPRPDF